MLLLEAGKASHPFTPLPISFGLLIDRPGSKLAVSLGTRGDHRKPHDPCSARQASGWLVGHQRPGLGARPTSRLRDLGPTGKSRLELVRRRPNFQADGKLRKGGDELRGGNGPQSVSEIDDQNPLYDAIMDAAEAAGHPRNPDYNGTDQEGIVRTQASIRNGRRMSTAECYLKTARHRQNLMIVTEAHVSRLILEGKRCVGVTYERGGQVHEARACREVILSAGAIGSPQILELSGIGRPDLLKACGIELLHEMDAVGENLRDHIIARMQWKLSQANLSYNHRASGLGLVSEVTRYFLTRRGFLSLPAAPIMGFLKSRPELASPDIQLFAIPYAIKDVKRRKPQPFPAMGFSVCQLRPESLGSIHVRSADPYAQPAIRFNFMSERVDQETMITSVKMAREIADQSPLDEIRGIEFVPGADVSTDDEIEHWIRSNAETAYHPIGTCRMGPNGVVDDHLRVYGLRGLRVADASIFPTMPSGNTNAPSIMVGEKCADLIKADAAIT